VGRVGEKSLLSFDERFNAIRGCIEGLCELSNLVVAPDGNPCFKFALAECGDALLQLLESLRQTAYDRICADGDRQADCEDNTEPSQEGWKTKLVRRPDNEKLPPVVELDCECAVPPKPVKAMGTGTC